MFATVRATSDSPVSERTCLTAVSPRAVAAASAREGRVRHSETHRTGAHRNRPKRSGERTREKPERNRADRSGTKSAPRSLDHNSPPELSARSILVESRASCTVIMSARVADREASLIGATSLRRSTSGLGTDSRMVTRTRAIMTRAGGPSRQDLTGSPTMLSHAVALSHRRGHRRLSRDRHQPRSASCLLLRSQVDAAR